VDVLVSCHALQYDELVILIRNTMAKNIKTRISITIIPTVNILLEKISKKTGMSKSALVENALKDYLQHQLEEDVKALSTMHFDDLPSENDWLSIQSETNSND